MFHWNHQNQNKIFDSWTWHYKIVDTLIYRGKLNSFRTLLYFGVGCRFFSEWHITFWEKDTFLQIITSGSIISRMNAAFVPHHYLAKKFSLQKLSGTAWLLAFFESKKGSSFWFQNSLHTEQKVPFCSISYCMSVDAMRVHLF